MKNSNEETEEMDDDASSQVLPDSVTNRHELNESSEISVTNIFVDPFSESQ